jgi:Ca-activated chloride channel family protein
MKKTALAIALLLVTATTALADGIIVPIMPPRPDPRIPPNFRVNVKYHHVDVAITDPVAITKIDQVFVNPAPVEIEADYIFPIPENAAISRFVAFLGGKKMEGELLDAAQARRVYEDIVRRRKDPALLEYSDRGMYRMRIYPIPAHGEVRMQIEYEQTLKSDGGTVEYLYPLNTEKYSGADLEDCKVELNVTSFENIGTVYCPTHDITTERLGEKTMKAVYRDENVRPDKDIVFYFTRQKSDFGFQLLTYRERGEKDGFFLGILSPPLESRDGDMAKNVIFVLDSSGSMRGQKIAQAIEALRFCLGSLNRGDRFNIIDYDDSVRPYKTDLIDATKANVADALAFADDLDAGGGTNIYDALDTACRMLRPSANPTYILFLTDGLPTVGNTDIEQIIKNTTALNEARARIFVFGVGYDVNTNLLDRLAQGNHGLPEYVTPEEDIEAKVSRLASKISRPALTDLALSFNPKRIHDVYPSPVPDLFYGSEIIFTGRYDADGPSHAIVTGKIGSRDVRYEFPVSFAGREANDEFIPLLWANRRIGFLLQELRMHGQNQELLEEVIALSKKYGIITEYTSFLVTGDERVIAHNLHMPAPEAARTERDAISKMMAPQTGESAVGQSSRNQKQATADNFIAPKEIIVGGETRQLTNITQVGSQAFYQVGSNWIQSNLTEDKYDIEVKRFSEAYFQILDKDPSLGRYLGLGSEVRLQVGSQVVQISDNGKERFSASELAALFEK